MCWVEGKGVEESETGDVNYLKLRHLLKSPEPSINTPEPRNVYKLYPKTLFRTQNTVACFVPASRVI